MSLIKFAHASDIHLGTLFSGISKSEDRYIRDKLIKATFLAYDNLILKCIDHKVDALIISGDTYELADKNLLAQQKFRAGIEKLHSSGIKVFVCRGNHDPLDGWDPKLLMPNNYKVFGPEVESFPFFEDDPEIALVHGISYPTRVVEDNLALRFPKPTEKSFNIGVLHANVGNNAEHDPYSPCSISDLVNSGYDYWALGHIHKRQILKQSNPAIVYPGNTQSRHRNETGEKGFYIVDANESREISMNFEPIDVVRFADLTVNIDGLQSIDGLLIKINELIKKQSNKTSSRDVVFNVVVTGAGIIHDDFVKGRYKREEVLQAINENWTNKNPFVWCGNLSVNTRPEINREEWKKRDDFLGNFFTEIDSLKNNNELQKKYRQIIEDELYKNSKFSKYLSDSFFKDLNIEELIDNAEKLSTSKIILFGNQSDEN